MNQHSRTLPLLLVLAALVSAAGCEYYYEKPSATKGTSSSAAQEENIKALESQIKTLEDQITATQAEGEAASDLQQKIAELEKQIQELTDQLAAAQAGASTEPPETQTGPAETQNGPSGETPEADTVKPTIVSTSTLMDQRSFRVEFSSPMDFNFVKDHKSIVVYNPGIGTDPLSGTIMKGEGPDVASPKKLDFVLAQKAKKVVVNGSETPYQLVVIGANSTGGLKPADAARDTAGNPLEAQFIKAFFCGGGGKDSISCASE